MRKNYLFYALIFTLIAVGCKKKYVIAPGTDGLPKTDNGTGTITPPVGTADLVNFRINGAECAYDETTHAYYYPVPSGNLSNYTVTFDTTAAKSLMIDNVKVTNGGTVSTTLTANQEVAVKALNKIDAGPTFKLIITGLPIVILKAGTTIADADVSASFNLINPDYAAQKSQIEISSKIMISIRGGVSKAFPKKSYKVHLVDDKGEDTDVSLMGLRTDNNWILDAMYIDQGRIRNRVCTDLWNSFNNVPHIKSEPTALNGTRGYMAEVFLDGRYNGVYCLTEKLDRKQLQIKKQYGDMYKSDFWTNETDFQAASPYDNTSVTWGGWAFEYPDLGDSPAPTWKYLSDLVTFISTSSDDDFTAQIKSKVDINNMVDYFIFMNVTQALDNQNKNTFLSFYDYRTPTPFFYSIWDMDGTMGRNAGGNFSTNQIIGGGNNNLFQRLLKLNPANFKSLVKTRWNSIKASQLSKNTVSTRVENYRKLLVGTNAIARERVVWGNLTQDLNTEASYMNTWYNAQYDLMDGYFNGL